MQPSSTHTPRAIPVDVWDQSSLGSLLCDSDFCSQTVLRHLASPFLPPCHDHLLIWLLVWWSLVSGSPGQFQDYLNFFCLVPAYSPSHCCPALNLEISTANRVTCLDGFLLDLIDVLVTSSNMVCWLLLPDPQHSSPKISWGNYRCEKES